MGNILELHGEEDELNLRLENVKSVNFTFTSAHSKPHQPLM